MSKIQANLREMKATMKTWTTQPLFERKEGKKVCTLSIQGEAVILYGMKYIFISGK